MMSVMVVVVWVGGEDVVDVVGEEWEVVVVKRFGDEEVVCCVL